MIVIAPFAQKLRNAQPNPKNWPTDNWKELIHKLQQDGEHLVQVGVHGEAQLVPTVEHGITTVRLREIVRACWTWVSVDSFFQHLAWDEKKPGVVLFAQSDPTIFGHPENINLLKSRTHLREKQFWLWEQATYNADAYVDVETVYAAIRSLKTPREEPKASPIET
jgi:ADP-heptose:LPS heptosyltransferase